MEFIAKRPTESSVSKLMKPGTHYARIVDIKIDIPAYNKDAMSLTFILEGPELPDFTGAAKNKLNPSEGNYKGQIAYVKSGKYAFSDFEYRGEMIKRDTQIFKFINKLCENLGVIEKMEIDGVGGETIEEYIYNASKYLIDEELYAYFTLAGKEEKNEYGVSYRMFFPKNVKNSKGKYITPYLKEEAGLKDEHLADRMIVFDETKHIEKEVPLTGIAFPEENYSVTSGTITTTGSIPTVSGGLGSRLKF